MARRAASDNPRGWWRRFLVLSLTVPSTASALGVDGGVIFQILAVEDPELSPAAIGTALGLGVVSIPLQLWAARMPLELPVADGHEHVHASSEGGASGPGGAALSPVLGLLGAAAVAATRLTRRLTD